MTTYKPLCLLLLVLVLLAPLVQAGPLANAPNASSAPAASVACTASSDDAKAVADTLRDWYAALSAADEAGFRTRTAPDYSLFEDGTRMSADELIAAARKHLQEGDKATLTIDAPPQVEVDCNVAQATFSTHGSFEHAGKHMDVTFLESAALRKENGRWRIAFFHSTPLAKPEEVPPGSAATPAERERRGAVPLAVQAMCSAFAGDGKAVADTVRAFYEAERTGDSAGWQAITMPDFYMFHEGIDMSPADFVKFIDQSRELTQKYKAVWTMDISDLKASVDCTTAFATLTLHNLEDADAPMVKTHPAYDETFLESFWLRNTPDGWKIAFWNASKVPKAPPAVADGAGK